MCIITDTLFLGKRRHRRLWLKATGILSYFKCSLKYSFQKNVLSKTFAYLDRSQCGFNSICHKYTSPPLGLKTLLLHQPHFSAVNNQVTYWMDSLSSVFQGIHVWNWLAVHKGLVEKSTIGVIKGNSSFMFTAVSAALNVIVDNAKQRPVWEKRWDFHPEAFYLAHHSVTPYWARQVFKCRTEKDPDSHLPSLQQAMCNNIRSQSLHTLLSSLSHSGSGQWQDRATLLVSKWICPP